MATNFETLPVYVMAQWGADGLALPDPAKRPRWSGEAPPPALGAEIHIPANGIGPAIVLGYSVETGSDGQGFLNVRCRPLNPPAFLLARADQGKEVHAAGAEVRPITDEIRSQFYKVEFRRAVRDCAHNSKIIDREERRLSRHQPRGDRRHNPRVMDYEVMINGEWLGIMSRKSQARGYRFLDLGDAEIEHPDHGHSVATKALFEKMVRAALAAGLVPGIDAILKRHGLPPLK